MTDGGATEDTTSTDATTESASWREAAVARSLNPARQRAEKRVQRFLDAAQELLEANDGTEFTVQDVVDRSGQSLRSFYQYFGGKHELLMALFEESVQTATDHLSEVVAAEDDPLERLHRFVVEYYRLCRPAPPRGGKGAKGGQTRPVPSSVMVEFAQQLLTARPADAARVFVPLVALFEEIWEAADAAGFIRDGFDRRRVAGVVLESIMFNAFSTTIAGTALEAQDEAAEELWTLLFRGLAGPSAPD